LFKTLKTDLFDWTSLDLATPCVCHFSVCMFFLYAEIIVCLL